VDNQKKIKMYISEQRCQSRQESTTKKMVATMDNNLIDDKIKNRMLKFLVFSLAIAAASIMTSCNSPAEKVENSQKDVTEAKHDLEEANAQYKKDVENYRVKSRDRISANNERIAEYRTRISRFKSEERAQREKQIEKLEQENDDLEARLEDYEANTEEGWEKFKTEFSNDMNELGTTIKGFGSDDK